MRFYFHNTSAALCLLTGLFLLVPASAQDGDPTAGETVYDARCFFCHNPGSSVPAPRLGDMDEWQKRFDGERMGLSGYDRLEDAVRNGVPGTAMQAQTGLSAADIKNVVAYLLQAANVNTGPAVEPPGKISDTDPAPNQIAEDAADGAYTGITAAAENSTRYALVDDAGGRFSIVADGDSSGRVTVADGGLINYEASTRHQVIVQASNTAGISTAAFTIQITNAHEITLQDTLPDDNNTVDAVSHAEVQGLELQAVHADDEPIVAWTIAEDEPFKGTFEFTESQNSSTQKLRISQSDKSIPTGRASVKITAGTKHDRAVLTLSIQIEKVEASVTAELQHKEVAEGERTTLVLSMSRTLPDEASLLVRVTNDGSRGLIMLSTDTVNFVPGPITAAIAAAERSATLTIRVDDDGRAAAQRTAFLQVTSSAEKLTGLPQNLRLSITADAKAEISLEPSAFMLPEDQSQVINLTLSPPTAEPVTVTAAIAEAEQNQIALLRDGSQVTQSTVSFTNNGMFTVYAVNDDAAEMEQMHAVTLEVSAGHADLMPGQDEITVTIPANDTPTLTARLSKDVIAEGNSAEITFSADRPPAAPVIITASLSPDDDNRVSLSDSSVVLAADQTEVRIALMVANDDKPQRDRSFKLSLETDGPIKKLTESEFSFTVPASDTPVITFSQEEYRVSESAEAPPLVVRVNPPPVEDIKLRLTTEAPSTNPLQLNNDYEPLPTIVVLRKDQPSTNVRARIINDADEEEDESIEMKLSLDDSGVFARLGKPATARLTVLRNDQLNNLTFELESANLSEGTTKRFLIISRVEGTTQVNVTVDVNHRDQIAVAKDVHSALQDKLTLEVLSESSVTFYVTAKQDAEPEPAAEYKIYLEKPNPAYTYELTISTLTITVGRNDGPVVSVDSDRVIITEGSSRTFMLAMASSPVDKDPVTIQIRESDERLEIIQPPSQLEAGGIRVAEVTFRRQYNLLVHDFVVRVNNDKVPQRSSEAVITLDCIVLSESARSPCADSGAAQLKSTQIIVTIPANDTPVANVRDGDESDNTVAENASAGLAVGITVVADYAVGYELLDDAAGRFALQQANSSARVIVASGDLLNYEASTRHQVTVEAYNQNRADAQRKTFTIVLSNVNETTLTPDTKTAQFEVALPSAKVGIAYMAEHPDGNPELSLTQGAEFFELVRSDNAYELFAKQEALMRGRRLGEPQDVTVQAVYQEDVQEHSIIVTISGEALIRLKIKVYLEGAL